MWGVLLSPVPHHEALARPSSQNEQRRSPRRYANGYAHHRRANTYPMDVNRCLAFDYFNRTAKFRDVKTQSVKCNAV